MIRRGFVGSVLLVVLLAPARPGRPTVPAGGQDFGAQARRIHAETIGIDSHIDTLQRSGILHITAALLERGYSEQDVKKILGGNFLRVMRQVIGR